MRSIPMRLWVLVLLSALLQLLPFPLAGPVPEWRRFVSWLCLVPLLMALCGNDREDRPVSVWAGAALGYGCGVIWFFGNCYWIYQTMFHYGGLPTAAAWGILVLFSLYLGLYLGGFGAAFAGLRRLFGTQTALGFVPLLWVAVELARDRITGFPWDLLGYTQIENSYLLALAPVTGVMGLSLVVAAGNALWLWRPQPTMRWLGPAIASSLLALSVAAEFHHAPAAPTSARAVLLQDNLRVGAEAGTREGEMELLDSFARLTSAPRLAIAAPKDGRAASEAQGVLSPKSLDLIAWPEAPTPFADADPKLRAFIGGLARAEKAPLVVQAEGETATSQGGQSDKFVSASFYLPDGSYAGRYDKMHLVPFGEYTPYKPLFFFAGHLMDELVLVPGKQRRVFSVEGHRFGVFICYESIFGEEIREFARSGAQVLVNLSDDGWYGDTSAPWEHLDMARMRAIETRRWLLRDTNTGLTAAIDPEGRVVAALPRHVRDAIEVPFGYRSDLTFYTRHGDWIGWICAGTMVSVLAGGLLQRRYPARTTAEQVN